MLTEDVKVAGKVRISHLNPGDLVACGGMLYKVTEEKSKGKDGNWSVMGHSLQAEPTR